MTNQNEWYYREPSDPYEPRTAPTPDSGAWIYREPTGPRPDQPFAGNQDREDQSPAGWGRAGDGTGQPVRNPWTEPDPRRPPPHAYGGYRPGPPPDEHTRWDMPATRDYQPTPTGNRYRAPENRPRAQEQHAPNRTLKEPPASPRLWGLVALSAALGLLLDSFAVAEAPTHYTFAGLLFWPAAVLPNVAFAAVLLSRRLSRALRHFTIALVGVYSAILYRMSSPFVPGGFDEHLHERTLSDLLHGSGLFAPNPLLNVSPNYPGMELFTGIATRLGDVPYMVAATLVILLCRYLLVLAIYEGARTVNASPRFASLVVLLYATSPQFFFFNSQFAYQTMAVPLGLGGLLLVRRAQALARPCRAWPCWRGNSCAGRDGRHAPYYELVRLRLPGWLGSAHAARTSAPIDDSVRRHGAGTWYMDGCHLRKDVGLFCPGLCSIRATGRRIDYRIKQWALPPWGKRGRLRNA